MDDAIWVIPQGQGYRVSVSIADVALEVPAGSALDQQARERLVTRYHRFGVRHMLDRWMRGVSLIPHAQRFTITVEAVLSEDFEVVCSRVYLSQIKNAYAFSYKDIPVLTADPKHPLGPFMVRAQRVAEGLLAQRKKTGAQVECDLVHGVIPAEEGGGQQVALSEAAGHMVVQEFMILANTIVAQFAQKNGIPILYRNHAAPEGTAMFRARYEETNAGHHALGVAAYCHFTSPIRRYADLVNHQQIRAHLKGAPLPYTEQALYALAEDMGARLQAEGKAHYEAQAEVTFAGTLDSLEYSRLGSMSDHEFGRLVKALLWQKRNIPEFVELEYTQRIRTGTSDFLRTVLLGPMPEGEGWKRLQGVLAEQMIAQPNLASICFHHGQAYKFWPAALTSVTLTGPVSNPLYHVQVVIPGDTGWASPIYTAFSQKVATQRAMVGLFTRRLGYPDPTFPEVDPVLPPPLNPTPELPPDHPVTLLVDWCQKHRMAPPVCTYETRGPAHQTTFICTVVGAGVTRQGEGSSKAKAKAAACAEAYRALVLPVDPLMGLALV